MLSSFARFTPFTLILSLSCWLSFSAEAAPTIAPKVAAKGSARSAKAPHAAKAAAPKAKNAVDPSNIPEAKPSPLPSLTPEPKATPTPTPTEAPAPTATPTETAAPTVEASPTAEPYVEAPAEKRYGKTHGLLGPVPLGPTATLLSVPHLLQVGLEGKYEDYAGFGFLYGVVPSVKVSDVSIKMNNWDVSARWFAFRGSFFLGASYGSQKLTGSKSQNITASGFTIPTTVGIELKTTYLTPHLGWRWLWKSGFFYGLEMGWQLALSSSTKVDVAVPSTYAAQAAAVQATPEFAKLNTDVVDKGNKYGKVGLPHLTLIQIGWLF